MKVLGINGSSRKDGNTALLIREVFGELEQAGIRTELVQLADLAVDPCRACFVCAKTGSCAFRRDAFAGIFDKMVEADGILLGSPVYSADVSARMKALLERAAVLADMRPGLFRHKAGAAEASQPWTPCITFSSIMKCSWSAPHTGTWSTEQCPAT